MFSRLGFELHADVIHEIAQCKPWVVENVLTLLRDKIEAELYSSGPAEDLLATSRTALHTARYINCLRLNIVNQ